MCLPHHKGMGPHMDMMHMGMCEQEGHCEADKWREECGCEPHDKGCVCPYPPHHKKDDCPPHEKKPCQGGCKE